MTAKLGTPASVQQTHQHDAPEKSQEHLDTQVQNLQHASPGNPTVPAHTPPEKSEILPVTQPQTVQPISSDKPIDSAVSQTPSMSSVKHEDPAGPQAQALQQSASDKSEKPAEIQEAPQHIVFEKPVEAQAQPDSQHVSS
ncbi:hypothetical protein KCU77_g8330, partial [Aureobasidium melanogenum]